MTTSNAVRKALETLQQAVSETLRTGRIEVLDAALASLAIEPPALTPITKIDPDRQLVYGWALVTSERGEQLIDLQDDVVDIDDLRESVHKFIGGKRQLGYMHQRVGVGEVVESIILSHDIQKALGIDLGREGWFVGVHVSDPAIWSLVKGGNLSMFSIGGTGERTPMTKRVTPGSKVRLFADALHA